MSCIGESALTIRETGIHRIGHNSYIVAVFNRYLCLPANGRHLLKNFLYHFYPSSIYSSTTLPYPHLVDFSRINIQVAMENTPLSSRFRGGQIAERTCQPNEVGGGGGGGNGSVAGV